MRSLQSIIQPRHSRQADLKCLVNADMFLEMDALSMHDLWINTKELSFERNVHKKDSFARILNFQGHPAFGVLNNLLLNALMQTAEMNKADMLTDARIDVAACKKVDLIDYIADKWKFSVFKNQAGYIGVKTQDCMDETVPEKEGIVWLAGPVKKSSSEALKLRKKVFAKLFAETEKVAAVFNRPKPTSRWEY